MFLLLPINRRPAIVAPPESAPSSQIVVRELSPKVRLAGVELGSSKPEKVSTAIKLQVNTNGKVTEKTLS